MFKYINTFYIYIYGSWRINVSYGVTKKNKNKNKNNNDL